MRPSFLIGAFVVAIGAILLLQLWPGAPPPEVQPPAPAAAAAPPADASRSTAAPPLDTQALPAAAPAPAIELPALRDSDAFVREQIAGWPLPATWLQRDDLLSRAAVIAQNAARGRVPRRQVAFMTPAQAYKVVKEGERFYVDPASYARYDGHIDLLEAMPAEKLAGFARLVAPLLAEALAQLDEQRAPAALIDDALARIANLPELPARIELLRPNVLYVYADPQLENLPDLEKQVLRMGPRNVARLQTYLAEFRKFYLAN